MKCVSFTQPLSTTFFVRDSRDVTLSRRGSWKIDADRFKLRVCMAEIYIEPHFNPEHRELVYKQRQQNKLGVDS